MSRSSEVSPYIKRATAHTSPRKVSARALDRETVREAARLYLDTRNHVQVSLLLETVAGK